MKSGCGSRVPAHLRPVEEFRERDVSLVAERMEGLEVVVCAVLELDPQEVTVLRGRATTELEGKSRSIVGCKISHHAGCRFR